MAARHSMGGVTEALLNPERDWDTLLAAAAAEAFTAWLADAAVRALDGEGPRASSPADPDDEVTYHWLFLDVRRHPPAIGGWVIPGVPTIGCSRCGRPEPFGESPVLIAGEVSPGWDERTKDEWDDAIGDDILAGHAALVCRDCLAAEDLTPVDREWFGHFLRVDRQGESEGGDT
ncbi:MAG: hypothetical protein ACTHMY_18025 [Solirubrobacteraceae bacterium]